MSTVPFVAKIRRDWRYPHRPDAFEFIDRPPPGFQALEPPDWASGTLRGEVPSPRPPSRASDAPPGGLHDPGGAFGSLFDDP